MNFYNVVGTGSYTTSTTNMYNKYQFHVPGQKCTMVRIDQTRSTKVDQTVQMPSAVEKYQKRIEIFRSGYHGATVLKQC
jgi:hypothetical protein